MEIYNTPRVLLPESQEGLKPSGRGSPPTCCRCGARISRRVETRREPQFKTEARRRPRISRRVETCLTGICNVSVGGGVVPESQEGLKHVGDCGLLLQQLARARISRRVETDGGCPRSGSPHGDSSRISRRVETLITARRLRRVSWGQNLKKG